MHRNRQNRWIGGAVLVIGAALVYVTINTYSTPDVPDLALSQDGRQAAFAAPGESGRSDLYILDIARGRASRVTATPEAEASPSFSPDGRHLVFEREFAPGWVTLATCRADGSEDHELLSVRDEPLRRPAFVDAGRSVAFIHPSGLRSTSMGGTTWARYNVEALDVVSGRVRCLTPVAFRAITGLAVVPRSRLVVFCAEVFSHGESKPSDRGVFIVPVDGARPPRLIVPSVQATEVAASSDAGGTLLFRENLPPFGSDEVINVVKADGSGLRRLLDLRDFKVAGLAACSSTGRAYYVRDDYYRYPGGHYDLWSIDIATGKQYRVADESLFSDPLTWSGK